MSDQTQPSSLDLFKVPASSTTPGLKAFDNMESGGASERSFSRELSRATDRAAPSRETHRRTSNDRLDRTGQNSKLRSDKAETEKSVKDSATTMDSNTELKSNDSTKPSSKLDESSRSRLVPQETTDEKTLTDSESLEEKALTQVGPASTVTGLETAGKDQLISVEQKTDVSTTDGTGLEQTLTDIPVALPTGIDITEDSGSVEIPESSVNDSVTPVPIVSSGSSSSLEMLDGDASKEILQTQRLITGEQLTPRQLANRQAHSFNQVFNPAPATPGTSQLETVESVESEIDDVTSRSATIAATVAASSVGATKDGRLRANSADQSNLLDASVKPAVTQSVAGNPSSEQIAAKLMLAADADAEAAANTAANVAAKQAEQQVLQGNLAQVRQLAQQQVQNMNMATVPVTPESADRPSQPVDNTFLSLPGGIVTAPVVQRPDAGMNQAINAPINMPILQNDADKAMAGNIRWMVNEGVKNAVVNVKPSGMGPISVTIGIEKDQMNVSIVALQGSTREALDSMLPRLREQLVAQGYDSVKVDISDGRSDQTDRGYGQQFAGEGNSADQNNLLFGTQTADAESDDGLEPAVENGDSVRQGLININESGQIRSRYDVYV